MTLKNDHANKKNMALQIINRSSGKLLPSPQHYITPEVEIVAGADMVTMIIDMPGVEKEWLDVLLENDRLTVEGIIRFPVEHGNTRQYIAYRRQFRLDESIDPSQIQGSFNNGELRISLMRKSGGAAVNIRIK